jgi:hypothetical protein
MSFKNDVPRGHFPAQDAIPTPAGLAFLFWTDQAFPFYGLR